MSTSWVGKTLGKVKIDKMIARGGMAEVYLGTHTTLDRKVAVKIMRNPGDGPSEDLKRFQQEARVIASLRHPNIVQVFDFDMVENDPYLVMEYVEGPSLSAYLQNLHKNGKKLPIPHVVRMLKSIASALQYAHNNKIVHRDIKPGNILLTSQSQKIELDEPLPDDFVPVLTDFGLIRFVDSARQTKTGITAGTPAYMSPEQAQGEATDGRTDVYSLGIVLYEMLAGKLPFDGETTVSILLKHVNEPPEPILGLSTFMEKVLYKALAKKLGDRYQTPLEFAKAFDAAVDINPATIQMDALDSDDPFTYHMEGLPKSTEQPKRFGWLRIVFAGIALLVIGAYLTFNGIASSASETATSTVTIVDSQTSPSIPVTGSGTSTPTPVPINLETRLVIHFRDENAIADQAFLEVNRVPAAPPGSNYEVWLFNDRERISLGILEINNAGEGELIYTDEDGQNLVSIYNQAEITIEPEEDTDPAPTKLVAFQFALPEEGTVHVRSILSSFLAAPVEEALIQGLYADVTKINELAGIMDSAYASGDEALARQAAESIINLISGDQSSDYKDWDEDGFINDESNGYGLELNGSNRGYLGAVFTEADKTVNSSNPSEPMLLYGENLKVSVQNLAQWTSQLQAGILEILEAPAGSDIKDDVSGVVILADQMLNGVDLNDNGIIEPILGESGAQLAYGYAYSMADMPLVSTGLLAGFGTPTPAGGIFEPTSVGNNNSGSTPQPGHTPPGQVNTKRPSKTPKDKGNNGGNIKGNGN